MEYRQETQLLTNSDCYRAGKTIRPMGIMVHSTGVAQPDPQVFIKSWNQPDKDACVHAVVSRDKVIQTLPWTMRAGTRERGRRGAPITPTSPLNAASRRVTPTRGVPWWAMT